MSAVELYPGWNLVSFPRQLTQPDLESVFPDAAVSRVLTWVDSTFQIAERTPDGSFDPSGGVTTVEPGRGYWVFTTERETLSPAFGFASPSPIELSEGWNLIGYAPAQLISWALVDDYLSSISPDWVGIYWFDAEAAEWLIAAPPGAQLPPPPNVGADPPLISPEDANRMDFLASGRGYWLLMGKAHTLPPWFPS